MGQPFEKQTIVRFLGSCSHSHNEKNNLEQVLHLAFCIIIVWLYKEGSLLASLALAHQAPGVPSSEA